MVVKYTDLDSICDCGAPISNSCKNWCVYQQSPTRKFFGWYFVILFFSVIAAVGLPFILNTYFHVVSVPHYSSPLLSCIFLGIFLVCVYCFTRSQSHLLPLIFGGAWILVAITFGEWFGWYTQWWDYLLDEPNGWIVLQHSFAEAWTFFFVMLPIGVLYLMFARMHPLYGRFFSLYVLSVKIAFGWAFDIYVNGFQTYLVTFFVWTILEVTYWSIVYYSAKR